MNYPSAPMMKAAKQTMRAWHSADLSKHDKLLKLLETYHKVHVDSKVHDYGDILTWCLINCQAKFRDIKQGDGMDWYFEHEQDALMFAMKWSS